MNTSRCLVHVCRTYRRWSVERFLIRRCSELAGKSENKGPLYGLRILDLSRVLAGPYCSMILGDLGAEVIKVERPGSGDDTRSWGPPFCGTESAYFLSVNRNKKSVAINIKNKDGQAIVKQLAAKCDVLLENYLPGKLSEMGLGYEQLSPGLPGLVYCSISGYGQTGPDATRAGYDVIAAATGGLTHITGPADGEPCKIGVAMTDLSTGLYALSAILAALMYRQTNGRGQHIDCNLLSTQVASLVNVASSYLNAGWEGKRYGTAHASIVPYQAFPTSDSYVMVGATNDVQFRKLCKVIKMQELSAREEFATNNVRVTNRKDLLDILSKRFQTENTRHWLDALGDSGLSYGPINSIREVFSDPQVLHNDMVQEMDHPTAGSVRVAGPAVKFSESGTVLNLPPPTLGQHTDEVLQGILGLEPAYLETLRQRGAIA